MPGPLRAPGRAARRGFFCRSNSLIYRPSINDSYRNDWLSTRTANRLERALARLSFREYAYRASVLRRAPKCEVHLPFDDGTVPVYRWGQSRKEYGTGLCFSEVPILDQLRRRLMSETGESPNHCIIIRYSDGQQHHAPPHRDRQTGIAGNGAHDMAANTSFFVVSVGYPRLFQLLDDRRAVVWEDRLVHGSLMRVTSDMNRLFWHAVPRDLKHPSDRPRYSAIFRTIQKSEAACLRR